MEQAIPTPIAVFERQEKKYLLGEIQVSQLLSAAGSRLRMDQYGLHSIYNIYYDTEAFDLIRTSIDKPPYKEKLRLRSYGVPKPADTVFVELKKKASGTVYKRRVPLTLCEAERYLNHGIRPAEQSQILREIGYFLSFYHPFPRLWLGYDRVAYEGTADDGLRLTIDRRIRSRWDGLSLAAGDGGELLLPEGQCLMELKAPGALPLWLAHLLCALSLYPASFSKYGAVYARAQTIPADFDLSSERRTPCLQVSSTLPV